MSVRVNAALGALAVVLLALCAGALPGRASATTVTYAHPAGAASHPTVTPPPFEPVAIQKITLPSQVTEASTPVFTKDGGHLLFFSGLHLWIVGTDGSDPHCISCGLANTPTLSASEQEGFATPFPDGKRIFYGAANSVAVLQCTPSVVDCTSAQSIPIDLSGARPSSGVLPGGGANLEPALDEGGGSSPKLSPDGREVVISDIVTDAVEQMTMVTLDPGPTQYTVSNPRVLNPAGPTSPTDPDTAAWSDSSALFEFKSFADGGADGTYVEVGGAAADNPDVWEVNFATGARTRLTSSPDWDEDDAPSPDGRSILVESDRGMHRVDMFGGMLPVRGFVDAPIVAILASYFVAGPVDRQCDLQPWLFPASGDDGAELMGEPIQPYSGGDVHAANNVSGYPQWSPNGTEIALNTESYSTNRSAPYLLIARLLARKPTTPATVVDSEPGSWAPAPADYHGSIGSDDHVVLHGAAAGTATVTYASLAGVVSGVDTVTYADYSDNGTDFVNGTVTVTDPVILGGLVEYDSHLTMTGADTGYTDVDMSFGGTEENPVHATGTAITSYDGTTISGFPVVPQDCQAALPHRPATSLRVTQRVSRGRRVITARVSASVFGAGQNEALSDVRPVTDATVTVLGRRVHTNPRGVAVITLNRAQSRRARRLTVTESAGQTFVGARRMIRVAAVRR